MDMDGPLGIFVGWYFLFTVIFWFYAWAKKTDKSSSPFERRLVALGYGLIWPVYLWQYIAGRGKTAGG